MSRFHLTIVLLAIGGVCALAGPITYTVNFGGSPAGSFVYDAAAPVGSQFSAFTVTSSSFTFDLTFAANSGPSVDGAAPDPCGTTVDSVSSFALLNGTLCGAGASNSFNTTLLFTTVFLDLSIQLGSEIRKLSVSRGTGFGTGPLFPTDIGSGQFSVASNEPTVPEPSAYLLTIAGLTGLAVRRFTSKR